MLRREAGSSTVHREVKPLREKWREHWEKRHEVLAPSLERANRWGTGLFWGMYLVAFYIAVFVLLPHYKHEDDGYVPLIMQIGFLAVEAALNWWVTFAVRSPVPREAAAGGEVEDGLPVGWKTCVICQLNIPARAHHCKVCQSCVLKRDHHCFFVGRCVGFRNQRHFVVLCFYVAVGLLYLAWMESGYLAEPFHHWENYLLLPALWDWLWGGVSLEDCLVLAHMYASAFFGLVGLAYFLWEILLLLSGTTSHEITHGISRYATGTLWHRFRSVMGDYGVVQFLVPLPFLSQPGNGIDWEQRAALAKCH